MNETLLDNETTTDAEVAEYEGFESAEGISSEEDIALAQDLAQYLLDSPALKEQLPHLKTDLPVDRLRAFKKISAFIKSEIINIYAGVSGPFTVTAYLKSLGKTRLKKFAGYVGDIALGTAGATGAGIAFGIGESLWKEHDKVKLQGVIETTIKMLQDHATKPIHKVALMATAPTLIHKAHDAKVPQQEIEALTQATRKARTEFRSQESSRLGSDVNLLLLMEELERASRKGDGQSEVPMSPEAKKFMDEFEVESTKSMTKGRIAQVVLQGTIRGAIGAYLADSLVDKMGDLISETTKDLAGKSDVYIADVFGKATKRYGGKGASSVNDKVSDKFTKTLTRVIDKLVAKLVRRSSR